MCLKNWAKNRIIHDRIRGEVNIPCPNYQCRQTLLPMDLIDTIGAVEFEKVNEMYTDLYLSHAEDIRRCPNEKCNYAGVIVPEVCSKPLKCSECRFEWREYIQMSQYQKTIKSLKDLISLNSESYSYVNEILTGCPCPKCGLVIWKDGGCNHMVCQKCNHEFCWLWLGHYPGYRHADLTFCPLRKLITFLMIWWFIITLDYSLWKHVPWIAEIEKVMFNWAVFIVVPNAFALAFLFEFLFCAICSDFFREWASPCQKAMRIPMVIIWAVYPLFYAYMCYYVYHSEKWTFILRVLFYEALVAAMIVGVIAATYFSILLLVHFIVIPLFKLMKYLFNKAWDVYMDSKQWILGSTRSLTRMKSQRQSKSISSRTRNKSKSE